jgi:hypothetical protein
MYCNSNLIGFAYPLYASFKALKTDGGDDDTQVCLSTHCSIATICQTWIKE